MAKVLGIFNFFLLCIIVSANGKEIFFTGTPKMNPGFKTSFSSNPFERHFESFMPAPSSAYGPKDPYSSYGRTVLTQVRMQSAIMAEKYLRTSEDTQCTKKSFCDVAALSNVNENAKATYSSVNVLTQMLDEVSGQDKEFPHISSLVAAYTVGTKTKNGTICKWLFACNKPQEIIEGRVNCRATSALCPGIAISCGLCAIISPETCGVVCPIAAIYCGTSGYSCAKKGSKKPKPAKSEVVQVEPEDEDDDDEEDENKETFQTIIVEKKDVPSQTNRFHY